MVGRVRRYSINLAQSVWSLDPSFFVSSFFNFTALHPLQPPASAILHNTPGTLTRPKSLVKTMRAKDTKPPHSALPS